MNTFNDPPLRPSTTIGWNLIVAKGKAASVALVRHMPGACRTSPCRGQRPDQPAGLIFIAMKCRLLVSCFRRWFWMPRISGEITEATCFATNRKMSRARYLEILRGALLMAGTEVEKAKTSTFNRLRRCLPTLANTLELSTLELQAVGSWTEIPQGGGRDPQLKKDQAVIPMGLHYAAAKVLRSAQVKQRCVDRLMTLFNYKRPELALNSEGLLCRDSWTWPEVAAPTPSLPGQDHACFLAAGGIAEA